MRCTTGRPSPPGCGRALPSPSTSRCSITAGGCIPPSATGRRSKRSPTTEPRRPPQRDQPRTCPRSLTQPKVPVVTLGADAVGRGGCVLLGGEDVMVEAEAGQRRLQQRGGTDRGGSARVAQRPPVGGADRPQAGGVEAGQPGDVEDPPVAVGLQQGGDGVVQDVRGGAVELSGRLEAGPEEVDPNDQGRGGLRRTIRPGKGAGVGHEITSGLGAGRTRDGPASDRAACSAVVNRSLILLLTVPDQWPW